MLRHRLASTVLLSTAFLVLGGILRPTPPSPTGGLPQGRFWAQKMLLPSGAYDLVLAGDSRIYRDLCPTTMTATLRNWRIANFGFSGCGLGTPGYLKAAARLLDRQRGRKVILLGIHGSGLTTDSAEHNRFLDLRDARRLDLYEMYYFSPLADFLRPYDFREALAALLRRESPDLVELRHPDGWATAWRASDGPEATAAAMRETLQLYGVGEPVSGTLTAQFLETVRRWTTQGITVYGFRPPVPEEMFELEARVDKFDENAFRKQFVRAGGIWLTLPSDGYRTYDASHLRGDDALRFSQAVAELLARRSAQRGQAAVGEGPRRRSGPMMTGGAG